MRVLILYTELMGYTARKLSVMASMFGADITAVCRDQNKKTPYVPMDEPGVRYLGRSTLDEVGLLKLFNEVDPDLMYVSGWEDKGYLPAALAGRKKGIPVVTGLDNQWRGDLRQIVGCLLSPWLVRKYFSHVQVAGRWQFEYARRLGFAKEQILPHVYSADTELFSRHWKAARDKKAANYPHCFLFVGRLHPAKGLDILIEAWRMLGSQMEHDWKLVLVGNGPLEEELTGDPGMVLKGFLPPEEVASLVPDMGAFVLPSRKEPWGVVVHEFAAAGLPLVLSDVVGAGTDFLIDGFNGASFKSEDAADLCAALRSVVESDDAALLAMGDRSFDLSRKITPEMSAASLLSPLF
jgi:glycosyltransferase involved in cell wall biosynthesis